MIISGVSQFKILSCFIMCLFYVDAYNKPQHDDVRRKRSGYCSNQHYNQNITLCQTANLKVVPFADSDKKSITVTFSFSRDSAVFKDCFPFYDIFIKKESINSSNGHKLQASSFVKNNYSHTFENISPGFYKIDIQPCYTYECCANLSIYYPDLINITSYDLLNILEIPKDNSIVILLAVASAVVIGIILTFSVLYYFCYAVKNGTLTDTDSVKEDLTPVKIVVYIFHYHDKFDLNKQKADILKDFLIKTSLYDSVKTVEDELSQILSNVNSWLDDVLRETTEDGKIQKIILIDSEEGDEEGAIENLIINDFIAKLKDNLTRCLLAYDNLFVVQMSGIFGYSDNLKNLVRRHRYCIPKHLEGLCLNLCSVSDSNISTTRKIVQEKLIQHPIRNLGLIVSA